MTLDHMTRPVSPRIPDPFAVAPNGTSAVIAASSPFTDDLEPATSVLDALATEETAEPSYHGYDFDVEEDDQEPVVEVGETQEVTEDGEPWDPSDVVGDDGRMVIPADRAPVLTDAQLAATLPPVAEDGTLAPVTAPVQLTITPPAPTPPAPPAQEVVVAPPSLDAEKADLEAQIAVVTPLVASAPALEGTVALLRTKLHEVTTKIAVLAERDKRLDTIATLKARRAQLGVDPAMAERLTTLQAEIAAHEAQMKSLRDQLRVAKEQATTVSNDDPRAKELDTQIDAYITEAATWWEGQLFATGPNEFTKITRMVKRAHRPSEKRTGEGGASTTKDQAWSGQLAAAALAATLPDGSLVIPRSEETACTLSEMHRRLAETGALDGVLNPERVLVKITKPSSEEQSRFARMLKCFAEAGADLVYVDGSGNAGNETNSRFWARARGK